MPSPSPLRVAVIDCGAGNLHSVRKALASQLPAGATLDITTEATQLAAASHIVLPGVGAFADCMAGLAALPGMHVALENAVLKKETPFLGVCVGMQMLFERGHEQGTHTGLGWFKGEVHAIAPSDETLRIPHMGWNRLQRKQKDHPFFAGIRENDFVYFVHSYAAQGCTPEEVLATVDYGGDIVSVVGRKNILATQFHPEKSQAIGLRMIHNFLQM
jgi:glutamine amidotransferase